jgi:hypothetical protein
MDQVLKRTFNRVSRCPAARGVPVCSSSALVIAVAVLLLLASCGVKAPPQPREFVVPAPVKDVAVMVLPEGGLRITFTLPSKSIDGHPIEAVGGYRIVREGPGGQDVREHKRFSVSEARQRVGQEMAFFDELPLQAGAYRYCVFAFDIYGIYTGKRKAEEFCWEGTLAGKGDR